MPHFVARRCPAYMKLPEGRYIVGRRRRWWQRKAAMRVTGVDGLACDFPIEHVIETMRPLPIEPVGRFGEDGLAVVDGLSVLQPSASRE